MELVFVDDGVAELIRGDRLDDHDGSSDPHGGLQEVLGSVQSVAVRVVLVPREPKGDLAAPKVSAASIGFPLRGGGKATSTSQQKSP